ncbi:ribonuclease H family protein [Halomonas saccharevitans]|uniref:ribonuclease H n=1 Tax=Halomonas saccharevitans TaxID=416872 RepID=A0ABU3NF55_9GAMM|nr:ribonuclease H family protein [Halomonas saccharevitans]MDT8879240.1 ribonuclease H family protein [Halomonas saccharevitans]
MAARKGPKSYVVWVGRQTGIFSTWDECSRQVKGYPKARYKSFPSREEAEAAFAKGPGSAAPAKRPKASGETGAGARAKTQGTANGATRPRQAAPARDEPGQRFDIEIYCDGACEPNPGDAGSGMAVYRQGSLAELWYGLHNPQGTNNTAELNAFHQALRVAEQEIARGASVRIHCDSTYTINAITKWAGGWKKRGWKKADGQAIKNPEIIQPTHALFERLKAKVAIAHVKGHAGVEGNELADRMAMYGADQQEREFTRYQGSHAVAEVLKLKRG